MKSSNMCMLNTRVQDSPVDDVWDEMLDNFGQQTINDMLKGSDDSLNSGTGFGGDSKFFVLGFTYFVVFGIIGIILDSILNNKFEALQLTLVACGVASTIITILFMNATGKNEKNYLHANSRLQRAYSVYLNKGFNDLSGKPLDYVKNND